MSLELPGGHRHLHVVGDRVLILPEDGEDRTRVGLYLPATALDQQPVQSGTIVATGPGDTMAAPDTFDDEPWKAGDSEPRMTRMQAKVGDTAIFFRKAAVEINYNESRYLVVPQAAILVLIRDDLP